MENDHIPEEARPAERPRAPANVGAFVVVFLFVWIVFDSIALALIFGLLASGSSELVQRTVKKASD